MERQGKQSGTRQMIDLLKLGQQHGQRQAAGGGRSGVGRPAVRMPPRSSTCCTQDELRRSGCEAIEVGALERYERPLPVMTEYDQLLTLGGAR